MAQRTQTSEAAKEHTQRPPEPMRVAEHAEAPSGVSLEFGLVLDALAAGGGRVGCAIWSSKKTRLPCEGGTEPVVDSVVLGTQSVRPAN